MRIRTVAVAVSLATATALTGCGGETDSSPEVRVLSEEQIKSALITVADIGTDFRIKDSDDDESEPGLGCLDAMNAIDDGFAGAQESEDVTIEATPDPQTPEVGHQINAFVDEAAAIKALDDFAATLEDCDSVETTEDGATISLEIERDDATSTSDVDQQFNIDMRGVISGPGVQLPVSQRAKFMRIGNVITGVYFASFETSTTDEVETLAEFAVAKILPVIDGKAPGTPEPLDLEPFTG